MEDAVLFMVLDEVEAFEEDDVAALAEEDVAEVVALLDEADVAEVAFAVDDAVVLLPDAVAEGKAPEATPYHIPRPFVPTKTLMS